MKGLAILVALVLGLAAPARAEVPGRMSDLMGDLLGAVDPWFRDLGRLMGDLTGWHAPEVLPNGDILIRRRHPADPDQSPGASPDDGEAPDDEPGGATPFEL